MIVLQTSNQTLEISLGAAIATNEIPFYVAFDELGSNNIYNQNVCSGTTQSTTPVDIVSTRTSTYKSKVSYISVVNNDTASVLVYINFNDTSTLYSIIKVTLSVGDKLEYQDGAGFNVITSTGAIKTVVASLTGYQPLNTYLTEISNLTPSNDDTMQFIGGVWTNRTVTQVKTTLSLNNVENTALSTWAGSTNITTLGTIVSGTWNGNTISLSSYASGTLQAAQFPALSGEATTSAGSLSVTLTNSAVIGKVLTGYVSGAGTVAATDTILQAVQKLNGNIAALTTGVSSVFGRTGAVSAAAADYSGVAMTGITSLNGLVITANTGVVTTGIWRGTVVAEVYGGTNQTTYTTGDILYASASNTLSKLAASTSGYVLTANGAGVAPTWQAAAGGGITIGTTAITSGTAGRVLIESATNKVSEDSNLFFDITNGRLSIGQGSSPTGRLDIKNPGTTSSDWSFRVRNAGNTANIFSIRGDGYCFISDLFIGSGNGTGVLQVYGSQGTSSDIIKVYNNAGSTAIYEFRQSSSSALLYMRDSSNVTQIQLQATSTGSNYFAGVMTVGATSNTACAQFEVVSTTKGLLLPKMTTTQRDAIASPTAGLLVYNTTTNKLNFYNGSAYEVVTSA